MFINSHVLGHPARLGGELRTGGEGSPLLSDRRERLVVEVPASHSYPSYPQLATQSPCWSCCLGLKGIQSSDDDRALLYFPETTDLPPNHAGLLDEKLGSVCVDPAFAMKRMSRPESFRMKSPSQHMNPGMILLKE